MVRELINKLKRVWISNKVTIQNFSYLSVIQILNLLLPLVAYPYLIRVLGMQNFGLVVFAQAIVGYILIFVNYGFDISATKEISIYRENKNRVNEIVISVIFIKSLFFIISLILLLIISALFPTSDKFWLLILLSMWICLYDVIFPIWYFQGIEKMKYITIITFITRLVFLGLIFIFINEPNDFILIPILYGVGALIAGGVSLYIIFIRHKIRFKVIPFVTLLMYLRQSTPIFISNLSISLYASTNKVIVGAFLGMTEVAYYDLAEKIIKVLKLPQTILSQAVFPKISKEKNLSFIKKLFNLTLIFNVAIFLVIIIFSKVLVEWIGGIGMLQATVVINILAITIPIIAMSNIFGIQMLVPFGYENKFSKIIIVSSLIYLMQISLLWIFGHLTMINITLVTVITEVFVTGGMFYYCRKFLLWV